MKLCQYCECHVVDDSIYCTHCGQQIADIEQIKEPKETTVSLHKSSKPNEWGKLGLMIFLVSLFLFDGFLATLIAALQSDPKIIFIISFLLYLLAIVCGILSFIHDHKDKKHGFEPSGSSGCAIVAIVISGYIAMMNLSSVILK